MPRMRIGLIGAGNIGTALATRLVALGHDVAISNSRGPQTLVELVEQLGPRAEAVTTEQTIAFGDVLVVTVPLKAVPNLPTEGTAGKTLLDTCNYYPERDGQIEPLDTDEQTEAEWVAAHFGEANVVKAFNSIQAAHIVEHAKPATADDRRAIPIAGSSAAAKLEASQLIDQIGFDPYDAGELSNTRRFQNGGDLYGAELSAEGFADALRAG